MELAEITD